MYILLLSAGITSAQTDSLSRHEGPGPKEQRHRLTNAWYFAGGFNWCKTNEADLGIGRSYVAISGIGSASFSYGLGAGYAGGLFSGKAFGEISSFNIFLPMTFRAEYLYSPKDDGHYLRPCIGINFFYVDILYNYSFRISRGENDFTHGVVFRIKIFTNPTKWDRVGPQYRNEK